jgi:hypothetical protein
VGRPLAGWDLEGGAFGVREVEAVAGEFFEEEGGGGGVVHCARERESVGILTALVGLEVWIVLCFITSLSEHVEGHCDEGD